MQAYIVHSSVLLLRGAVGQIHALLWLSSFQNHLKTCLFSWCWHI